MKTLIFVLSLLSLSHTFASENDVHFKGDNKHFVKTDLISQEGKEWIKYAGCIYINADLTSALCTDIAIINQEQIEAMHACFQGVTSASMGGVALGFFGGIIGGVATGGLLVPPAVALAGYSIYKSGEAGIQSDSFDKRISKDLDYTSASSYSSFISGLKISLEQDTMTCDVYGETLPVSGKPYKVKLN